LDKIIVNYWKLLSEKTSRLRRKEETSLYKIILCGYLISRPFDIRELHFGSSFYRFAGFRKTRKNKKIQEKSISLSLFFLK